MGKALASALAATVCFRCPEMGRCSCQVADWLFGGALNLHSAIDQNMNKIREDNIM